MTSHLKEESKGRIVAVTITFRSVRIFLIHAATTAIPSTASIPTEEALVANSLAVDAKTRNVIGFRGFSSFRFLEGGD